MFKMKIFKVFTILFNYNARLHKEAVRIPREAIKKTDKL